MGGAPGPPPAWLPRVAVLSADWALLQPPQHPAMAPRLIQAATSLSRLALLGSVSAGAVQHILRALRFTPQLEALVLDPALRRLGLRGGGPQLADLSEVPVVWAADTSDRSALLEDLGLEGC